jgi:hypothetical protein
MSRVRTHADSWLQCRSALVLATKESRARHTLPCTLSWRANERLWTRLKTDLAEKTYPDAKETALQSQGEVRME